MQCLMVPDSPVSSFASIRYSDSGRLSSRCFPCPLHWKCETQCEWSGRYNLVPLERFGQHHGVAKTIGDNRDSCEQFPPNESIGWVSLIVIRLVPLP